MNKERVGLLGGTFNPVHQGHLRAAQEVRLRFDLSRVLFIPSYIPPHKQTREMASPEDRFAMVKLACESDARFIPSSIEIEAKEKSYSIITLNKIKRVYREALVFFILGIDSFQEIETWKSYRDVLEQCHFIVISRPGYLLAEARTILPDKYRDKILDLGESLQVEDKVLRSFRIFLVPIMALDISSTDVRRRIGRGQSIKGLVPEAVEEYIKAKKLYQEENA